jgi:hypothetical protein
MDNKDEVWRGIVTSTLSLPPSERLAAISQLLLAHRDAASTITPWLVAATGMVRSNSPASQWLPAMASSVGRNPLVAGAHGPCHSFFSFQNA